jgi:hypothetical protein
VVVSNFRAASAAAQHQQPCSPAKSKSERGAACSRIRRVSRRDVGVRVGCALGGVVLCAVAGPVNAATVKNIVLVHCACVDGSGWKPVYVAHSTTARSRPRPELTRASWGDVPVQRTISR